MYGRIALSSSVKLSRNAKQSYISPNKIKAVNKKLFLDSLTEFALSSSALDPRAQEARALAQVLPGSVLVLV